MTDIKDIRKPVEEDFARFQLLFRQTLRHDDTLLKEALEYVLMQQGKQLRPTLVLLAAKLCRGISDKTLQAAVALELLHTASLVHDDVVDASPFRRGQDALQMRIGNKAAVLVGDFMMSKVVEVIATLKNTHILNIIANLGAKLASGELLQLHTDSSMWITEERYYDIISRKTAQLFAACLEAGAESAGAGMRQTTALRNFGWHLGMCFQLKDDVLDYSDSEDLGKPTMNDIQDGKATLPLIIALQRATPQEADAVRHLAEDLTAQAAHINRFEAEQTIKSFVMKYDGVQYAYRQMQLHKQQAVSCLDIFRDSATKTALLAMPGYAINRIC